MAMSSNRSPSPLLSRAANPNLRSSESNSTIRRSFSGNPFARPSVLTNPRSFIPNTPANSPADFGIKQTGVKEGASRGFEEKENEKDSNSKGVKFKSPSKGSKNFMSPTISAASKFTPSPRKKILGERNESIRTSISFVDGKEASVEEFYSKSEMDVDQKKTEGSNDPILADFDKKEVVLEVPSVSKASKRVTFSEVTLNFHKDSESLSEITSNSDCAILGVPLVHKTSKGDTFSPVPLNFHNDSESFSVMTMNSDCVDAESISNNMFDLPSISPILATPEVPLIPEGLNGNTFSQVPLNSHNKSETVSRIMDHDFVNVESSFKNMTYSSPVIAPLDADPSCSPYDPKTNYLSPRPKFLRYKPNPRIEVFLNKEKGHDFELGKGLEESFVISDNSSDTDVTEETHSRDSQKESEDGSSSDMTLSDEEQEEPLVLVSYPITSHFPEQTSEVKKASKPRFFTRSKCISLVLVLLIACVSFSVTDIPVLNSPAFKDSSFYKLYDSSEVAMFAKENFDGFARSLMLWSSQTISYLSKLIPHLGEEDHLGILQFSNLTVLEEHSLVDGFLGVNLYPEKIEEIYEEDEFESVEEGEAEMGSLEEKADSEVVIELNEGESGHGDSEVEEVLQVEMNDSENSEVIVDHEQSDTSAHVDAEPQSNIELEDQLVLTSQAPESRPEIEPFEINQEVVTTTMEFQVDNDVSSAEIESNVADAFSTEIVGSPVYVVEDKVSVRVILGISSLVLAIVTAATTVTYMKLKQGKNAATPNNVVQVDPVLSKKIISSPISAEHIYQDRPFSQNWPTEFDVVGESSYPSEMSSFQKSSSKGAFKEINKAQSQERKLRKNSKRESLASSEYSMGSPTYGSFTTYERIPIKHASGDEEIATPVRRSSRIRSQVISP